MRKVLIYNSWKDKAPFGALKVNQEPRINVYSNEGYNVSNIRLVLFRDNQEVYRYDLQREDDRKYSILVDQLKEKGIYFYYFEVNVEINGNFETLFYGKSKENGQACEYRYEDINKYQITVYEDYKVPSWYKEGIM